MAIYDASLKMKHRLPYNVFTIHVYKLYNVTNDFQSVLQQKTLQYILHNGI